MSNFKIAASLWSTLITIVGLVMRKLSAFVIAALMATPAMAATNIVTNGGFEEPAIGTPYVQYNAPSSAIVGWTVTGGSVDLVDASYKPFQGNQALDLVGDSLGTITQQLSTVVGQLYQLSFFYSNNPDSPAAFPYTGMVTVSGLTGSVSHSFATRADMAWTQFTGNFVGSGNDVLKFQATSSNSNGGIFLDAVSASAVPEPSTWALMIAGFGIAGFGLRRRRGVQVRFA